MARACGVKFQRSEIWLFFLGFLSLIKLFVNGHPQCLDSRPPFQSQGNLFCGKDYEQYGCCTPYDDYTLQTRYERIRMMIPPAKQQLWNDCSHYAKTFLCQTCSPYAAHIFDAEASTGYIPEPRAMPGMCKGYCRTFFAACKDLVQYYMDEAGNAYADEAARLSLAITNETEFCDTAHIVDLDYCYPELLSNPILNGNISLEKITQEGCLCVQAYNISFRNPVFLENAGDGSNRLFVGEQIGLVHIMYPDGTLEKEPFLDIRADIQTTPSKGDERGMLGMAFHPQFSENGKFYIYYSTHLSQYETVQDLGNHKIRIEEFKVLENNSNKVDYNYSRIILEVYEPFWNHNGGEVTTDSHLLTL